MYDQSLVRVLRSSLESLFHNTLRVNRGKIIIAPIVPHRIISVKSVSQEEVDVGISCDVNDVSESSLSRMFHEILAKELF
jgi:hypothetical protein